jgi:hypothetical protein
MRLLNECKYFQYEKNMPDTRESYVRQARGVLVFLRRKLARLQSLGIYDAAEIIITGDHGKGYLPTDLIDKDAIVNSFDINPLVLGGARPLFLHKPSGANSALKDSNRPLHLSDVVCILSNNDDAFNCDAYRLSAVSMARKRHFFYYIWTDNSWNKQYMPPMAEFELNGDARDGLAWTNLHLSYAQGAVKSTAIIADYQLNQTLNFTSNGLIAPYLKGGWYTQESDHRWTEGPKSQLALNLKDAKSLPLTLRVYAIGFPDKENKAQEVHVIVNNQEIGVWSVLNLGWYRAVIPAKIADKGRLYIQFQISHPTAPCEVSDSPDCRKLGIAVKKLVVTDRLSELNWEQETVKSRHITLISRLKHIVHFLAQMKISH